MLPSWLIDWLQVLLPYLVLDLIHIRVSSEIVENPSASPTVKFKMGIVQDLYWIILELIVTKGFLRILHPQGHLNII